MASCELVDEVTKPTPKIKYSRARQRDNVPDQVEQSIADLPAEIRLFATKDSRSCVPETRNSGGRPVNWVSVIRVVSNELPTSSGRHQFGRRAPTPSTAPSGFAM